MLVKSLGGWITGAAEGILKMRIKSHDRWNEQNRLDEKEVETGVEICA